MVIPSNQSARRLVVVSVLFLWVFIGGILFLSRMQFSRSTMIQQGDAFLTVSLEKSIVLAPLECLTYNWQASGLSVSTSNGETNALAIMLSSDAVSEGVVSACNSRDAAILALNSEGQEIAYPLPVVWLNPFALLYLGLCITGLLILIWRPIWLGQSSSYKSYVLYFPVVVFLAALHAIWVPSDVRGENTFNAVTPVLSLAGFFLIYLLKRSPRRAYITFCLFVIVLAFSIHTLRLFVSPYPRDIDELFYSSAFSSAANGFGLGFPLMNFPPMPVSGGLGHGAWLYVLAYQLLGPTIYNLRLVTLFIHLATLPAIFLLFRRWYGTITAFIAVALFPLLWPIMLSFVVRMDALPMAWACWGLLLVDVAREKNTVRWHIVAGFFLTLGLQAHIHTAIATMVCAGLYLGDYISLFRNREQKGWPKPVALVAYLSGIGLGLVLYVVANILPDPHAFFSTIINVRSHWFEETRDDSLGGRLLQSFAQFGTLLLNFNIRMERFFVQTSWVEIGAWCGAFLMTLRFWYERYNRQILYFFFGAMGISIFIFSMTTPMYWSHITPMLFLGLPPFLMFGSRFQDSASSALPRPSLYTLFALSVFFFPLLLTPGNIVPVKYYTIFVSDTPALIQTADFINEHVSPRCTVMGPYEMYLPHYLRYGRYYSSNFVWSAMAYYNFTNERDLWDIIQPDIIIDSDISFESLRQWAQDMKYEHIGPSVLKKTRSPLSSDCVISSDASVD